MRKATQSNDVTVKDLKQHADIFYDYIKNSFNFLTK